MEYGIVCETDVRYMRYEPNPYRGDRYAIYERRPGLPDCMLYCTHNKNAAFITWDRVKELPIKQRHNDFIEW